MRLFVPKESSPEPRVAADPASVKKLVQLGLEAIVEAGAGLAADISDDDFREAGAAIVPSSERVSQLGSADLVARIHAPAAEEIPKQKRGGLHVSFLDPFHQPQMLSDFADAGISAVSLEFIPRTTLAQKMDALSSQANLAGYMAVVLAAERLSRILPMLMTPAGTLSPARVFIIGAGVAGLQAIATAKRLGARVEAFDTRPAVEEQVKSLGAKFVKIDVGETGQTEQGYAKELTPEQLEMQRQGMAKICAQSDIVITTAKLFGRKAPIVVTKDMVSGMKRGSVIVDLAAEAGGNVEGTVSGEETVTDNGVRIVGLNAIEARVSQHASQMFAANVANFIEHFWDTDKKTFEFRLDDEILKGCLLTHGGEVIHERFRAQT
jgi:NAD(P) transhydrogenase subunit alpha